MLVTKVRTGRTIYSFLILPQPNLNKEFPRFDGRPVSNLAKLMALDTTFNKTYIVNHTIAMTIFIT